MNHVGNVEAAGQVDQSALQALPPKTAKHAVEHIGADETAHVVLIGGGSQALIALDERLIIVKPGFMAGASFGARVTSFAYRDIAALEVNTGMMNGVIEVITSGYQGTKDVKYWSTESHQDPYKISNCLPAPKKAIASWSGYLEFIRTKIREAKSGPSEVTTVPPAAGGSELVDRLGELVKLHASGALTDDEFASAKAKLLA